MVNTDLPIPHPTGALRRPMSSASQRLQHPAVAPQLDRAQQQAPRQADKSQGHRFTICSGPEQPTNGVLVIRNCHRGAGVNYSDPKSTHRSRMQCCLGRGAHKPGENISHNPGHKPLQEPYPIQIVQIDKGNG